MSLYLVTPLITEGYGLADEDLDEIIRMENLRDVSERFSDTISIIKEKFGSRLRMRIIEYDELSSMDEDGRKMFNDFIATGKHVFYSFLHSNRDSCVVFFYSGMRKEKKAFWETRILPHEFSHHFQWNSAGFPCFLPMDMPQEWLPQYVKVCKIGPKHGQVYVDDVFVDAFGPGFLIKDLSERISDFVSETLIHEKGFCEDILEEYRCDRNIDPAKTTPSRYASRNLYYRRLALRDVAEWHAILKEAYQNDPSLKSMLNYDRKHVLHLNKAFDRAGEAFQQICEMSVRTDCTIFKDSARTVEYMKNLMSLLNIELRTEEKW